jgi:hypothetical protein
MRGLGRWQDSALPAALTVERDTEYQILITTAMRSNGRAASQTAPTEELSWAAKFISLLT